MIRAAQRDAAPPTSRPPTESTASTTSGTSMLRGDSCDVRRVLVIARRAVKGEEEQAEHIKRVSPAVSTPRAVEHRVGVRAGARGLQNFVLAEKAGKARRAGDGQRGGQHVA